VIPHYASGQWSEGPDWLSVISEGTTWWRDVLRNGGYITSTELAQPSGIEVILYRRIGGRQDVPPFFIEIGDGSGHEVFSVSTLADALDLMARWAPVVTAALISDTFEALFGSKYDNARYGEITNLLATIRANEIEGHIEDRAQEIIHRRAEDRREQAERRRARQAADGQGTP
jgi:hypothetical protein